MRGLPPKGDAHDRLDAELPPKGKAEISAMEWIGGAISKNSNPAEKRSSLRWVLAPEFSRASAKAHERKHDSFRSAKTLLPPHKCGGSHRKATRTTGSTRGSHRKAKRRFRRWDWPKSCAA